MVHVLISASDRFSSAFIFSKAIARATIPADRRNSSRGKTVVVYAAPYRYVFSSGLPGSPHSLAIESSAAAHAAFRSSSRKIRPLTSSQASHIRARSIG